MSSHDIGLCVKEYLGDIYNNNKIINNYINFPHDNNNNNLSDIISKYERRFTRLHDHICNYENIFIMITRNIYIEQNEFDYILNTLIGYNKNNKIIFISGINYEYLIDEKYINNVLYKYIYYDVNKLPAYDYSDFRPNVKTFISSIFKENKLCI